MENSFFAVAITLLTTLLLVMSPVHGSESEVDGQDVGQNSLQARQEDPNFFVMTADVLLARPLLLLVTGVGVVIFVISSPFSALGGNINQAANTLVAKPAKATFVRCLGCSYTGNKNA
ncbi:MAG: hypothetical protein KAG53_06485 [Endozoicomonadaceae bacterium]|nr:hypothetical protein [Endozoicomonadaceae bacterium]